MVWKRTPGVEVGEGGKAKALLGVDIAVVHRNMLRGMQIRACPSQKQHGSAARTVAGPHLPTSITARRVHRRTE